MITVVAIIKAQDGNEGALRDVLSKLASEVAENEPCNRRYDLFQSLSESTTILVFEQYDDQAAFDAHVASTHFKAANAQMRSMVAGRAEIHRYEEPA